MPRFAPGGRGLEPFAASMLRLVASGALTGVVIGLGCGALLFSRAPEWASLIFEPFSLLLMPGLAFAIAVSGPHDLDPEVALNASIIFYFLLFFGLLQWRSRRGRHRKEKSG